MALVACIAPLILMAASPQLPVDSAGRPLLTIPWIEGDTPSEVARLPHTHWMTDGRLLVLDTRKPPAERTFEVLDPATLVRSPACDATASLESLKQFGVTTPETLPWPLAIDPAGSRGVYLFNGDVFLLDLATSRFRRLTHTSEPEKAVQIAPDGSWVSYVRSNDLYAHSSTTETEHRLTTDGSETLLNGTLSWVYWEEIFGRRDIGYWWNDDSTAIAFLQTDESPVDLMHFVDFEPVVPRVHTQRYPKAGRANPKVRVGIVPIAAQPDVTWVNLDPSSYEYIARVQWLPDSRHLSVQSMNRAQDRLWLDLVDRQTGQARRILEETDPAWVNIHDDLRFLDGGRSFLWASERDGYAHLYHYDINGQLIGRVTKGPWSLRSSGGGAFWLREAIVAVDEPGRWVYFTALEKSPIEIHLYRARFDGSGLERISSEDGSHGISMRSDGAYYVDRFSTITTPPSLRLHSRDGTAVATLADPRIDLVTPLSLQFPDQTTIPARDGFPMPAEILKPREFDPNRKYPVILYVYGGPSAPTVANAWRRSIFFDNLLASRGYLVVLVDNRASTAQSHILETLINLKMSGDIERNDVLDAVEWLKSQSYVDASRIGVWGWSGGGSFTINLMTHSTAFKAGIAVAAVTDWRYYDTKWAENGMKTPDQNPDGYKATSFVQSAKNLHGRLLLVHGTYDDNVHPQHAWAFVNQLVEHNIPFDMMFYPMRGHGISDKPARIHLFSKMLEFWEREL